MKKTYLLIDGMNLFFRASHSVSPKAGIDAQIGMGFHILLSSLKKVWNDFDADHAVFCLEGDSFRKRIYPEYKLNRKLDRLSKTETEKENSKLMLEAFDDLCKFIEESSNITTLRCPVAEADDMIATWIDMHPEENHIIVSTDSDFYQLLAPNVKIYNGVKDETVTVEGFFDKRGQPVIDTKTKIIKEAIEPEYYLFEKCIRGDKSDNIFSAYPGASLNGTKNRIGIKQAFADKNNGGYSWNNFMLQRWVDHNGEEQLVKDKYDFNRELIDLRAQPEHIKLKCIETILDATTITPKSNIGIKFMRFCGRWDLKRISDFASDFTGVLSSKYEQQ